VIHLKSMEGRIFLVT